MQRFFQRDHDIGFDIRSTLRRGLTSAKSSECRAAATAAEKRFEEIAESRSPELELDPATIAAPLMKPTARLLRFPAGWRLEPARPIPIGAELIVFLTFFRIARIRID